MKIIIPLTLILIAIFWFSLNVKASEDKQITITDEAFTVSYDFTEVTASASVNPNPCNQCILKYQPSFCLVECEQIIIYD